MGKFMIIPGADFSANKVGNIDSTYFEESLDMSQFTPQTYSLNVDKWGSSTSNKHIKIDVGEGWGKIKITAPDSYTGRVTWAFLTAYNPVANTALPFCNDAPTVQEIAKTDAVQERTVNIPSDCKYIVFTYAHSDGTAVVCPKSLVISGYRSINNE